MLNFLCKGINGRYGVPRLPVRKSDMLLYGIFILSLCVSQVWGDCVTPCPTGCTCSRPTSRKECMVNCTNAGLTGMPSENQMPDSNRYIKFLYLDENNITSLASDAFSYMTNLEEIYLQGNNLNSISSDAFHLNHLKILDLSNNPITIIGGDLFDNSQKLENLNLSRTQLTSLADNAFDSIQCLKELDLSLNNLQSLSEDMFKKLTCLEVLNLSGNDFNDMASIEIDFADLSDLITLDISNNQFTTFPANRLSLLTDLQHLNIANNPFECTCTLMAFRNELVTMENNGIVLVDRNDIQCLRSSKSLSIMDQSEEGFWCPERLGSCYYNSEDKVKYNVLFSYSTNVTSNQTCIQECFDNNSTYGIYENQLCMCGYKHDDTTNDCWCSLKTYASGQNMACRDSSNNNIVFVGGVYPISAGLTMQPYDILVAGAKNTFRAQVDLTTIVQYTWSFGDSSETRTVTTSLTYYDISHTYSIPGVYTLTVTACTAKSACRSIAVPVEVRPTIKSDDLEITCPTSAQPLSSPVTITGKLKSGYNAELKWYKQPFDNVTAVTEGHCEISWEFFHGRCLQTLGSSLSYASATGTCNGGDLLTIHYPEEITDLLTKFSTLSTIYLGAQKDGNGYKWTNGNPSYIMAMDTTDSSVGDCLVIDRTTGGLLGVACTSSHSIICQQTPDTECPYGGYYYSTNNKCYNLYTTTTLNWSSAKSACEALTTQSELAIVDSSSLGSFLVNNVFQSTTGQAWVGLTDRDAENYLMWTNNQSVVNYNPVGSAQETDCVTIDDTGSWSHFSCQEEKYYICQYSLRETKKIPTYLAGIGRLDAAGVSYDLTTIASTSLPTSTITMIWLFPGFTISRSGLLRRWNFRTNALTKDDTISFQVYTPVCAAGYTLLYSGCNGHGGRYASCSNTVSSCPAVPYCNEGTDVCYHSNTCEPVSDPCSCTGTYCSTPFIGSRPTYRLKGQDVVALSTGQNDHFTVDSSGIEVSEGDILAFQVSTSSDLIKCEHTDIPMLQNVLQVFSNSWHSNGDIIDASSASWRNNTACYFQAVYTIPEEVTLPSSLQYSTVAGTYTYELSLPDSNITKDCTITVEEDVGDGDVVWLSPAIRSSSGGTETFYVGSDTETYLVIAAKRGTNLEAEWEIEGNTYASSFSSSCPSSVQTDIGIASDSSNYWTSKPFTFIQYNFTYNSGSPTQVKVKVKNSIGSNNKTVQAQVFLPLAVELNVTDFSHGYLVEINQATSFTTTVASGNPTTFSYYINGSSEHNATTTAVFTHTFTSKDVYEVNVQISDGFRSIEDSVIVYSRYAANVQSLALTGIPATVLKNSAVQFQATATVNTNAYLTVLWEFETGSVTSSEETSSTSLQLSKSHTHTINGTYTFRLTITDEFSNTATVSQTIRVVEEMPSVSLSASPERIQTGSSIDFVATVPNLATADYGTLQYSFDFNDTNNETSSSKEKIHTFSTAGIYYVTVSVSSGAQTVEATITVKVLDQITGLSINSNRIVEVNTSVAISATVTTGNALTYSFEVPSLSLSSGNITTNAYTVTLDQTGHFNVTLIAWNELFTSDVYKEIYVVDRDTLEVMKFTHDAFKAKNSVLYVAVDVLYYDYTDLTLTWYFGTTLKKGSSFNESHTFTTTGTFNVSVTIQSSTSSKTITRYTTVEIQDAVAGVSISNNGPIGLPSTGSVNVVMTTTVTTGTSLRYSWSYGNSVTNTTTNTLTLTKSSEEVANVSVTVWNDVSEVTVTTTYKVQQVIEGLQITCLNCTYNNNLYYLQSTKTASFVGSLTFGTDVAYNWDFGDSSSTGVGISQTKAYSAPGTYTITLSAVNEVGTVSANFTIYVQEIITSVSLSVNNPIHIQTSVTVTATAVGGSDISYAFQDCGTCDQTHQTSNVYTTGVYNESGRYIVAVKASNEINFVTGTFILTVLDYVTSVSVISDLVSGQYAAKGTSYTFSAQPNTYLGIYYNWSVKQASSTIFTLPSIISQNFTYTFASALPYEVVITVTNALSSSYTETVQVDAQEEISGVQVVMDKNSPIATGEALQVTAVVTEGTSLSYKWYLQNTTGQYILSHTTKIFSHTINDKGDYTFILEVQNNLGSDTANKTITVMEAVSGVAISSVVNESYPYIAVNTTVTFSPIVSTGESYTTLWTLTGISPSVTSSSSSFTYQFVTSGTYMVTLRVENTVSSQQYELTFHVQGEISSLSLVPDSSLVRTGQSVTFTANYNSGADNLIFEWTIEGTLTNVTSDTLTHVFATAGTIPVYITVYNHISRMSTQINITVEVPVSGLTITGCNTTGVINTAISATASAALGTDITYSYKLATGTTTSKSGTGTTVSHTYSVTGVYDLYINASNQVSLESVYCIFTIIGPISDITVNTTNSNFFVNYQVQFQVSGNNLIGVTYDWYFQPINVNVSTSDSLLQRTFTTAQTYTYTLIVYNSISSVTVTGTFAIEPLHCTTMTLTIGGQSEKIRKKSLTSTFEVMVNKHGCSAYILSYIWKVFNLVTGTEVTLNSNIATNTPKLYLDSTLDVGTFSVELTASYENTPLSSTVSYNLTVTQSDPVAIIDGGTKKTIPSSLNYTIDGSKSFDPDSTTTTFQYNWTCSYTYPLTPPTNYQNACPGINAATSSSVTMATANTLAGEKYTITLTVTSGTRTASTTVEIEISSNNVPVPEIDCVTLSAARKRNKLNPGEHVALKGTCLNCLSTDTIYYEWSVSYEVNTVSTPITLTDAMMTIGKNSNNFVLRSDNLPTADSYTFKLEISRTGSSSTLTMGTTELTIDSNTVPSGGSCTKTQGTNIDPLDDTVKCSCTGYSDPDNSNGELNYKVMSFSKDPASSTESVIIYYGVLNTLEFHVAPWPGTVRNAVRLQVSVIDEEGAETLALDVDISVSSTVTTSSNNLEFIQNHTTTTLQENVQDNNPTSLLQFGVAMTQEINEISRQQSSNSNSQIDDRNIIRNRIALSVLGLPLETPYQRAQMAFILSALTAYEGEFQTSVCHTLLLNEIDRLKSEMENEALQGADQSDFTPDLLVAALKNTMDAVNAATFNTVTISNVTTLESTALTNYKPEISQLNLTTSVSTETHKQNIVIRGFEGGNAIVAISLKTQLLGEQTIINLDNLQIIGVRTYSDDISQTYSSDGCVALLHPDMLGTALPTRTEVFQIMRVADNNPFTWDSDDMDVNVNSKIIAAGFTDTAGNEISVTNLQGDRKPNFFILKNGATAYANLTDSIVNSTSYDPNDGITFSSTVVSPSNKKQINIDISAGYNGAALHVQILFTVVANPSSSATVPDTITAYLGKNYVASKNTYETMKTIKTEYMANQYDHRSYTLFITPSDFDQSGTYTITVYNDDSNYHVNVSVGVYFSSCQFFDTTLRMWKSTGCTPLEESIERYCVCECDHFTPFGGGMLAPPNIISFSDLLDLDLTTNPVVFVACSLIFVVYIVALVICRRLDQSNLERISSIPLCGKDGSFKYEVTVITGRQPGSGTSANVGIRLYGEYGKSSSKQLDKKWAFQRNCQDSFIMAHDVNLGNIEKLMIWHDNSGLDPSWYLVQVIVKDLQTDCKYYFFANFWMSLEMEKGFIQKELFAAGSSEIQKFGRMFSRAVSNFMADRHLWYSVVDRPAQSRFTRVQRATCGVTILFTFMAINAMWYGLLKQQDNSGSVSAFGWEEVVLSFVTNVMAFPFTLMIIWMFKRSKSKTNIFEHGNRLGTAQTIEIDYDPNLPGSFKTNDDLLSYYDRESTTDSLVQATMTQHHLKRSKTLKVTRQATDDSLNKAVNSYDSGISSLRDSSEGKLKRTNNPHMWSKGEVGHKDETYITKTESNERNERKEEVKKVADGILQYLDDVESKCMAKEQSLPRKNSLGGGKSSLKRTGTKKTEWKEEIDDILNSDTETNSRSRPLQKKDSTSTISSYGKPASSQSGKGYNPREDPNINGHDRKLPSAGSTFIWANKLRASGSMCSTANQSAMPEVEGIEPLQPDMGLAARSDPDREDMQLIERHDESKKCTLPAWFVYVAYVICFLLSVTSVILIIMYGQRFGADVALQWILALLFCIAMSFIVIEPLKALVIALYASSILKKEDTADEDVIDIQPTIDTSNEKVKEVKFAPLAGFSLLNAKEEGQKIRRMRTMIRQFIAYMFYLWLLMTLSYVNYSYETYLFKSSIDNTILQPTISNTEKSFINISDVDEFWTWSQSALVGGLHYSELNSDLEYGILLGVARMRMVRSINEPCPATEHPIHSGLDSLTNRTCWGNYGFSEDESHYGEGWNLSQNLSWRYSSGSQTESKTRYGYVYTYGGGGYVHNLGTTYNDTLTILQNLQAKNWIDERTRAIFIDFTMYSVANDLTAVVNLMIEFPLTGGLNTSSEIQSQVLLRFVTDVVDPLMVCQCILFLVNIYLVCHIFNAIRDHRKEFFKDPWNWFEVLTTAMAIVVNGLYIGCVVEATSTFNDYFNNINGFTNFETISDTHVASRYVQAVLIFLLMIKVIKQLRFIKYLYIYERVLSDASGKLFGIAIIFFILFCTYGMVGYLFYGRDVDGFESYWHTLTSIVGMQHGRFSFWALMDQQPIFTHFFLYFYYAFCYGITIALILSVLNDTFKTTKGQMYYKATMEMQDYEMIDFIMRRFKLWAGIDKPKQGSRRVHFDRRQFSASSRGSRPSSRDSNLSYDPFETNPRTTRVAADRLEMTWEDCLCTLERVCNLDAREEDILKTTQKEIDEWKFQTRIKNYEREVQNLSDKPPKGTPSGTNSVRTSKIPRRTSTTGSEAGNSKRGLGTPDTRTSVMRGRPLSDQGGRTKPQPKRTNSRERFSIYNFFKSVNPSKDAWK